MTSRTGGHAGGGARSEALPDAGTLLVADMPDRPPLRLAACQRCGFPVAPRAWGCRNPCGNCGTVYPLGDCSD